MNRPSSSSDRNARFKEEAAKRAVHFVQSGMKVGLGTGSTAIFATRRIAELLQTGELRDIVAFATSKATAEEAVRLGIPMLPDDLPEDLDVTIDGADVIIVQQEAAVHLDRSIRDIRHLGKKAGGALCPATPVHTLNEIIEELDLVLVSASL